MNDTGDLGIVTFRLQLVDAHGEGGTHILLIISGRIGMLGREEKQIEFALLQRDAVSNVCADEKTRDFLQTFSNFFCTKTTSLDHKGQGRELSW